jgi:hypothetical protein
MKFNINDYVRVKLTPEGVEYLRQKHENSLADCHKRGFPGFPFKTPVTDKDGWSNWQLWDLMSSFGADIGPGRSLLFETEIEIPVP